MLPSWGMCVQDPGLVLTFGPAGSREAPERVGFSEAPGPSAKAEKRVLPSRAGGRWVEERCFRPAPGLGSVVGEGVSQRRWESEENLLLSARGLGWALWSARNL